MIEMNIGNNVIDILTDKTNVVEAKLVIVFHAFKKYGPLKDILSEFIGRPDTKSTKRDCAQTVANEMIDMYKLDNV